MTRMMSLIFALAVVFAFGAPYAHAQSKLAVSSSSFQDGARMGKKHASNNKQNPNCVGENISPALSWTGTPEGTKSFALVVLDSDARPPYGVSQTVVYGISGSTTSLAEGDLSKASDKFVGGKSTSGASTYNGPCTPPGSPHHYIFTLIATDLEPQALQPGLTRDELFKALDGHAKGAHSIVGTFAHP